ncbi:glutaredoxin family protein [Noviherbaspirillum aridicola]|uniref:DUF4124 domain-containing protein n=1 Tax=Noviherbaspirillum aridicola TaxID=2849687 RepID=A0ABQ4Q4J4_9BURK|nr:glutaredoxin family protein [Noviherbaspirillum aridicola]GIZ52029.1 hypothetical protein NCCP691_20430 [Noviherbaspirillum aridicola]
MKKSLGLAAMLLLTAGAQAQLYKSVGPDGKVTYSDTPPATKSARVETKTLGGGGAPSTAGLPYELAEAVRAHPVVLYSAAECLPCDEGRRLLNQRGVPFSEKTVSSADDHAAYKQIAGDSRLPLLTVGRTRERGFESAAWNAALTAAGYPETSRLPRNYRQPEAQALAQKKPEPKPAAQARSEPAPATDLPPATGNAPPGFRF